MRVGEVDIELAEPVRQPVKWVGQGELLEQIWACWTTITESDQPLCPRLVGKPGMGKTTLAQAAAASLRPEETETYIFQCTMDTRPEDLLITPVLASDGQIRYQASPLVSAMVRGGVAILDEANRMSEKSWASLAPLLDNRRYVDSIVAGVRIEAHRDFRCCITMNDDASTYEIPEYIISRIQPLIALDYPNLEEELAILRYNVDFAPDDLLEMCAEFLQDSHRHRLDYTTRDGINVMRYALKLQDRKPELETPAAFRQAVEQVLGKDADDFEARARESMIDDNMVSFEDLFGFQGDDDDVPPGRDDD